MNDLQVFKNPDFGEMRTIVEPDGKVLFCGNDVAVALGYAKPNNAISNHCRGATLKQGNDSLGRLQSMTFIPEGDVWRLIVRSNKPEAEKYERWIFDEVLPALHHTGTYAIQKPLSPAEMFLAQGQLMVEMERKVAEVESHTLALEEKIDNAVKVFARPDIDHWKEDADRAIKELCAANHLSIPRTKGCMYSELENKSNCNVDSRLTRLRTRKRKAGATHREVMAITKLDAIAADKQLRAIFEGVVRNWQAKQQPRYLNMRWRGFFILNWSFTWKTSF